MIITTFIALPLAIGAQPSTAPLVVFDDSLKMPGSEVYAYAGESKGEVVKLGGRDDSPCLKFILDKSFWVNGTIEFPAQDLTAFKKKGALELWLKPLEGCERLGVGLGDAGADGTSSYVKQPVANYAELKVGEWVKLNISLSDFPDTGQYWDNKLGSVERPFAWAKVNQVILSNGRPDEKRDVLCVDELAIRASRQLSAAEGDKALAELGLRLRDTRERVAGSLVLVPSARKNLLEYLDELAVYIEEKGARQDAEGLARLEHGILRARYASMFSRHAEGRTVAATSDSFGAADGQAIRAMVAKMASLNITAINPEVLVGGCSLYPSKIARQWERYRGWDPLEVLVDECHKAGIEVHAWVWCFNAGGMREDEKSIYFEDHPEMLSLPEKPSRALKPKGKNNWLCAARPEVGDFLIKQYKELLNNYDLDGILLDYIRYAQNEKHSCYYCRGKWMKGGGVDPWLRPMSGEPWVKDWDEWRRSKVSAFVKKATVELRKIQPGLVITAAVFPNPPLDNKWGDWLLQDFRPWVENGWIDILSPMMYEDVPDSFRLSLGKVNRRNADRSFAYNAIGPYKIKNVYDFLEQVEILQEDGSLGVHFFQLKDIGDKMGEGLISGPFRRKAVSPHRDADGALLATVQGMQGYLAAWAQEGKKADKCRALSILLAGYLDEMVPNESARWRLKGHELSELALLEKHVKSAGLHKNLEKRLLVDLKFLRRLVHAVAHRNARRTLGSAQEPCEVR